MTHVNRQLHVWAPFVNASLRKASEDILYYVFTPHEVRYQNQSFYFILQKKACKQNRHKTQEKYLAEFTQTHKSKCEQHIETKCSYQYPRNSQKTVNIMVSQQKQTYPSNQGNTFLLVKYVFRGIRRLFDNLNFLNREEGLDGISSWKIFSICGWRAPKLVTIMRCIINCSYSSACAYSCSVTTALDCLHLV